MTEKLELVDRDRKTAIHWVRYVTRPHLSFGYIRVQEVACGKALDRDAFANRTRMLLVNVTCRQCRAVAESGKSHFWPPCSDYGITVVRRDEGWRLESVGFASDALESHLAKSVDTVDLTRLSTINACVS